MHIHHHVDKLYWKLFIGITAMHMLEDSLMVTFFKFAPLPLWVLYIIVLAFSGIMANYAYFIAKGHTPMSVWNMVWKRK